MFQADTDREQQDFLLQQRRCSSPSSTFRFLRLLELMEAMCILPGCNSITKDDPPRTIFLSMLQSLR